jgi:DNA polymerase-3 subunit gamma/tau
MHRPALARRYRPRRFAEIAAQDHVSATLRAAVQRDHVAHAYLFCGPRGVGKTTAARVLAMALNCERRAEDGEPCGTCESCERIWSGRASLDVVEIDAASNRGVDDARDLRERALYAPSGEKRFKVYIVDEAHMLTREAWNALLKILEEPPPRVIFVFATTEPTKILQSAAPILSRCQRFDFRRISTTEIVQRLRAIAAEDGIEVEDAALTALARRADGALRDALSALDQVWAFSDGRVTAERVRAVLGVVEEELYFELFEILAERRAGDVFGYVQRLVQRGVDLAEFYRGLADALRLLLRCALGGLAAEEGLTAESAARYGELAARFHPGDLLRMLAALAELDADGRFRKSEQPRILLEALLVRFAWIDRTVDLETVLGGGGNAGEEGGSGGAQGSGPAARSPAASSAPAPRAPKAAPGERAPEVAPSGGPLAQARAAWERVVEEGKPLRPGQKLALRAARVVSFDPSGELALHVAPGEPAAQALDDAALRRALEQELSQALGRDVRLRVGTGERAPRLTESAVRETKTRRLREAHPGLEDAIAEWDLELRE